MLDFTQAIQSLEASKSVLILPSSPADGDSLGAALAMQKVLQQKDKKATVVLSTEVPEILRFLPDTQGILTEVDLNPELHIMIDLREGSTLRDVQHEIVDNKVNIVVVPENGFIDKSMVSFPEPEKKFDLILTVDTADLKQLGAFFEHHSHVFEQIPSLNIDHHPSNTNYATVNLIDTKVSSTTQLLYRLLKEWAVSFDADVATLLLAGIITDTGSFQNANTTPEAFDAAAELVELGARQQEIIKHVYKTKHLQTLKLWGRILSNIQVDEINKIVWSVVRRADFTETETSYDHVGDIIDELISNAEEAEVALLLVEKADGTLHGSIRTTTPERDASHMASVFGGGGHAQAAGFNIPNSSVNERLPEILQVLAHNGVVPAPLNAAPAPTPTEPSPTSPEPMAESLAATPITETVTPPMPVAASPDLTQAEDNIAFQEALEAPVETSGPDGMQVQESGVIHGNEQNEQASLDSIPEATLAEEPLIPEVSPELNFNPNQPTETLENLPETISNEDNATFDLSGKNPLDSLPEIPEGSSEVETEESSIKSIEELTRDFASKPDEDQ